MYGKKVPLPEIFLIVHDLFSSRIPNDEKRSHIRNKFEEGRAVETPIPSNCVAEETPQQVAPIAQLVATPVAHTGIRSTSSNELRIQQRVAVIEPQKKIPVQRHRWFV